MNNILEMAYQGMQYRFPNFAQGEYKETRNPQAVAAAQIFWLEYLRETPHGDFWVETAGELLADFNGTFDGSCFVPDSLMGDLLKFDLCAADCVVADTLTTNGDKASVLQWYTEGGGIDPYQPCMPKDLVLRKLVVQFYTGIMDYKHSDLLRVIQSIHIRVYQLLYPKV